MNINSVRQVFNHGDLLGEIIGWVPNKRPVRAVCKSFEKEANNQLQRSGRSVRFLTRTWLGMSMPCSSSRKVCNYQLTVFGRLAQLDHVKIFILNEPNRSLFSRLSDILLLDPICRLLVDDTIVGYVRPADLVGGLPRERTQIFWSKIAAIYHVGIINLYILWAKSLDVNDHAVAFSINLVLFVLWYCVGMTVLTGILLIVD